MILFVSSLRQVGTAVESMLEEMTKHGFSERELFGMRLVLDEAIINSIKHGHQFDESKQVKINYDFDHENQDFTVVVEDQGEGFNPNDVADPLLEENLERPCGRGVFLMRHYTTWMQYNDKGNVVMLCKRKESQAIAA